jgi:hypothetical protein
VADTIFFAYARCPDKSDKRSQEAKNRVGFTNIFGLWSQHSLSTEYRLIVNLRKLASSAFIRADVCTGNFSFFSLNCGREN